MDYGTIKNTRFDVDCMLGGTTFGGHCFKFASFLGCNTERESGTIWRKVTSYYQRNRNLHQLIGLSKTCKGL